MSSNKNQGSVAPKERVNIRYQTATGGASEDVELPNKSLIVGDFGSNDGKSLDQRGPIGVNKDNFDDVMKAQKLQMKLSVDDKLGENAGPDAKLAVGLKIESIKDFSPDRIVEQVPELSKLVELRNALKAVKGPLGNVPEFRKKLAAIIDNEEARSKLLGELDMATKDKKKDGQ